MGEGTPRPRGRPRGSKSRVTTITAEDIKAAIASDPVPDTFAGMLDGFVEQLWISRGDLKQTALVQGLRAIASIAEAKKGEDEEKVEPVPLIADILADATTLPDERRRGILTAERARLVGEIHAIDEALGA